MLCKIYHMILIEPITHGDILLIKLQFLDCLVWTSSKNTFHLYLFCIILLHQINTWIVLFWNDLSYLTLTLKPCFIIQDASFYIFLNINYLIKKCFSSWGNLRKSLYLLINAHNLAAHINALKRLISREFSSVKLPLCIIGSCSSYRCAGITCTFGSYVVALKFIDLYNRSRNIFPWNALDPNIF